MLSPYRIMIGPKAEFPSYIEVDTSEELSVLRTLLTSHEMSAGGAMELRRHAMNWPFVGNRIHIRSPHRYIVDVICDAVASGTLVAAVALESDHANTTEAELRAMASGFPKPNGRTENIAQMSFVDKLQKALELVPDQLGAEFKTQFGNEIKGFFSPENLAITAAILAAWVGSHAVGVGFIVDGALLAAAFWFAGWQAIDAFDKIGDFIATVQSARSETQLKQAAGMMAAALAILGIAGLRAILRRAGPKVNKGASGADGTSPSKMKKRTERDAGASGGNAKNRQAGDADATGRGKGVGDAGDGSGGSAGSAAQKARKVSKRKEYLGATPGKSSRTGREVRERMRAEGTVRRNRRTGADEFKAENGKWYPVDSPKTHMGHHPKDAVDYWNDTGRHHGAKSKEVRDWMLDSKNYQFEYGPLNSSRGGATKSRYQPPSN